MVLGGTGFSGKLAYHAIGISKFTTGSPVDHILQHPGHDGGISF